MKKYIIRRPNETYLFQSKTSLLNEDVTYNQSGDDIEVTGYTGEDPDLVILDNNVSTYILARPSERYTLTIVPTPNDATVVLTGETGTQSGNTITVDAGMYVRYKVSKDGYYSSSGRILVDSTKSESVSLTVISSYADVSDYTYEYNDTTVNLYRYIGQSTTVVMPGVEGE